MQNLVDLDQVKGNEKPSFGELKMTIAQFFRVNGGSTQLRGVTPEIKFPVTGDFDQNGEQSYDNSLPWTSIPSADYKPAGDPTTLVPLLEARHAKRAAADKEWLARAVHEQPEKAAATLAKRDTAKAMTTTVRSISAFLCRFSP